MIGMIYVTGAAITIAYHLIRIVDLYELTEIVSESEQPPSFKENMITLSLYIVSSTIAWPLTISLLIYATCRKL